MQAIAAGYDHNCAIVNGGVRCWGNSAQNEFGDGAAVTSSPVPVAALGGVSGAQLLSIEQYDTCALVNGVAMCAGENGLGELGNGTTDTFDAPVNVSTWVTSSP